MNDAMDASEVPSIALTKSCREIYWPNAISGLSFLARPTRICPDSVMKAPLVFRTKFSMFRESSHPTLLISNPKMMSVVPFAVHADIKERKVEDVIGQ